MQALHASGHDPSFNLALEEALFLSLSPESEGIFLIWRNEPSIIIGRHQNTAAEVNADWCRAHGVRIVRRSTGGGAVYHDLGNVNFSFLTWVDRNRLAGFGEFMEPMVAALRDLGIDASFTGRNDILVDGRKVAGTAQRRDGQRMLHHGCLLVDTDTSCLSDALAADPEKFRSKGVASHRARVANLREFLPSGLDRQSCIDAVVEAMIRRCASGTAALTPEVLSMAETLAAEKYESWEWTWGKSPAFTEKKRRRFSWGRIEVLIEAQAGTVGSCRIFGDFFALRPVEDLEKAFAGCRADPASLAARACESDAASWFAGASPSDLSAFFLES